MRLKSTAILASVLALSLAAVASTRQAGELDPYEWTRAGDTDGDGLSDDFETRHGLDPTKIESYPDGIADEHRLASATLTMWDVQKAEEGQNAVLPSGREEGTCGMIGLEVFLYLGLLCRNRSNRQQASRRV